MNLHKYFNLAFFKENIRKSKSLLAFFLGVVPIINIITLIVILNNSLSSLITFNVLSMFTYAGSIFIPLTLSLALFGFIFHRKSVDFVMSKPISRRSLFITNTIGGIFLILIYILINALIFGIFGLIFKGLTIPFALLLDYAIFWFIAYIFLFSIFNLAAILSGNTIATLIIAFLMMFLVPFMQATNKLYTNNYADSYIVCESETCKPLEYYCYNNSNCEQHLAQNEYLLSYTKTKNSTYLAPLILFNNNGIYNISSMLKMSILSILYIIISYIVFKNRKMENNETSFKSDIAHYLVKTLVFIPVCFIAYVLIREAEFIGFIIALAGIIIYYIIYDLITKREIHKPLKSFLICLISFAFITGIYHFKYQERQVESLVISKIDKITYQNITITDQDKINKIIKSLLTSREISYYGESLTIVSNNQIYKSDGLITNEITSIFAQEEVEQNYTLLKSFDDYDSIDYILYDGLSIPVNKEIKKIIKKSVNKVSSSADLDNVLTLYNYADHKYINVKIPVTATDDLYEYIIKYQNQIFINKISDEKIQKELYFDIITSDANEIFTPEDRYVFNYVINYNLNSFINYLKTQNKVKLNNDYITINTYYKNSYNITISDVDKFKKEFDNYKQKVQDKQEYQDLLNSYYEFN